ncbi:MAG TPA: hypothetical protein VGG64_16230 [Pirellulales bacterium]|jgi:CheY-like chemotaxis protein
MPIMIHSRILRCAVLLGVLASCTAASAQALSGAAKPVGARTADDPVIKALLSANPTTPAELVRASKILVDLGHPALAQPFVQRLLALKLTDEQMADLVTEVGSAVLLRLGRERQLNPGSGQFCNAALDGAQRFARDPSRLTELVKQLHGATPHEHAVLVAALRPGDGAAVAALVAALADPARAAESSAICQTLVELGPESAAPLVAVLESSDKRLLVYVLDVLGQIEDPAVADYFLAPALAPGTAPEVAAAGHTALTIYFTRPPNPDQAAARLHECVRTILGGFRHPDRRTAAETEPATIAWRWDDQKKRLVGESVPPAAASLLTAVRLATDAHLLLPNSVPIRRLYLSTLAQAIGYVGREPGAAAHIAKAQDVFAHVSIDDWQDLLSFALEDDQPATAAVAAQKLGASHDKYLLYAHSPQASGLVRALVHPDRSLRYAALSAIMQLAPHDPYPGAGQVAESLEFFARSSGAPRALVAAATGAEAGRLGGLLAQLGYEPDTATDAAGVFRLVRTGADYELILVDTALGLPTSGQLIQRLRADSRTARIPLALVSLADEKPKAERLAARYPLCVAVTRTHDAAHTQYEVARLLRAAGRSEVDRDERRQQGVKALEWIATLATERQRVYDLRKLDAAVISGVDAPGLTAPAIAALAKLDTPRAQRALVNLASRLVAPIADRQAAAHAFADSVSRVGTLLKSDEILGQYDRYNASETQSKDTQQVLASILDSIEARAQADSLALEQPRPAQ